LLGLALLSACGGRTAGVPPDVRDDRAAADGRPTPDLRLAPDSSLGHDPLCEGVSCYAINDCCTCAAFGPNNPPSPTPFCPDNCKQPACGAWYLGEAEAYCLKGQCLLAGTKPCIKDSDCVLVDDCCRCMAAPVGHAIPECLADCFQSSCNATGLGQARPRCLGGSCRLSLE
jgi:hypothetical protein